MEYDKLLTEDLNRFHEKNKKAVLGTDADMETYNRIVDLHKLRVEELKARLDAEDKAEKRRIEEEKSKNEHMLDVRRQELEELKVQLDAEDKAERRRIEEEKSEFEKSLEERRTLLDAIRTGATIVGAFFTGAIGIWEFSEMLNFEETGSIRSTVGRLITQKWGKTK